MWVNKNLVFFYLKLIEVKHLSKLMKNNFFVGVVAASECLLCGADFELRCVFLLAPINVSK